MIITTTTKITETESQCDNHCATVCHFHCHCCRCHCQYCCHCCCLWYFYLSPSRDAMDDQFQPTIFVLSGLTMGRLILQAQELWIDMFKPAFHHVQFVLRPLSNISPSRDAVDDRFQRTLIFWLAQGWDCWIRKLKGFQMICWTMYNVIQSRFCYLYEIEILFDWFSVHHQLTFTRFTFAVLFQQQGAFVAAPMYF